LIFSLSWQIILHSAQTNYTRDRDGYIESNDYILILELTMPRSLGSRTYRGATNPEHFFAASYAACFGIAG
jgi:osmotically inducible protein OsmC